MGAFPKAIEITEEGPREGFQIESADIPTARKVELIDALSKTGIKKMLVVSFVNPKMVPGMADAEGVVAAMHPEPGVEYYGLWFNDKGLERAIASGKLTVRGSISLSASPAFLRRNQNSTPEQQVETQHRLQTLYKGHNVPITHCNISAAFGCNFEGDVPVSRILELIAKIKEIAATHDVTPKTLGLLDTMAWATPERVKRLVGAVQDKYPEFEINLHLHDTRGLAIANAYAGLEMGVTKYDAAAGGLGGCPFAGHKGAAGNICTEDLVFMCNEMGIETGIDLDRLIAAADLAEDIVGHPLPGSVKTGGTLARLRARVAEAAQ